MHIYLEQQLVKLVSVQHSVLTSFTRHYFQCESSNQRLSLDPFYVNGIIYQPDNLFL